MGIEFVGLCHFCDIHGPAFIWCTERTTFAYAGRYTDSPSCPPEDGSSEELHSLRASRDEKSVRCMGCSPRISNNNSPVLYSKIYPDDASDFYLSSSYPCASELKPKQLKELSIRCLSSEVSPSKENPVIFSDGDLSVMSLTFHLKDFYARGYKRLYGLAVISEVKSTIMGNIKDVLSILNDIKEKLCAAAEQAFGNVTAETKPMVSSNLLRPPSVSRTAPSNLCEVVDDSLIFERLHVRFCRVLDVLSEASPVITLNNRTFFLEEDFEDVRQLVSTLKPKSLTKLLYLILTSGGSLERILFDEKRRKFVSWPENLVSSLCGSTRSRASSRTVLTLSTEGLEDVIARESTKDSVFTSRLTHFITAENTSCKILELQLGALANQIQSLLEVYGTNPNIDAIPGLKKGDIEIIRALSSR